MNNETDIEVTSYVEATPSPEYVPLRLSPLQLQLLDTAAEMGMDTDWFQKEILMDENCLNGLELVTE